MNGQFSSRLRPVSRASIARLGLALLMPTLAISACERANIADAPVLVVPRSDVSLETDAAKYHPGSTVEVTLRNDSQREVGYNICFAFLELERQVSGAWLNTHADLAPAQLNACTTPLWIMHPGKFAKDRAYLPKDLDSGTYRLVATLEINDTRTSVATASFTVD